MVPDWKSPLEHMMYGVVPCPKKAGSTIAFGRCQQERDPELCAECPYAHLLWFPTEKNLSCTYKKTCQKAGHVKVITFICRKCQLGEAVALFGLGCLDKHHDPEVLELCTTCSDRKK